jgi:hypothetical protein
MDELAAVLFGGRDGYTLGTVGRFEAGEDGRTRAEVHLELLPTRDHPRVCSGCGRPCHATHDTAERWVRDLPILGADTHLLACTGSGSRARTPAGEGRAARPSVAEVSGHTLGARFRGIGGSAGPNRSLSGFSDIVAVSGLL